MNTTPENPTMEKELTEEEMAKALTEQIAITQWIARQLAQKRGVPLSKECDVCKGSGKCVPLFASLFAKPGDPEPEPEQCFSCKGAGKIDEFWPRYVSGSDYSKLGSVVNEGLMSRGSVGKFVSIRPCGEEYGNKTYLGLYIGDIAYAASLQYDSASMKLFPRFSSHNPAIFVFDLKKIIFGYESWWGEIESPEDLHNITDKDINNVWYVQALKQLSAAKEENVEPSSSEPVSADPN